MLVSSDIRAMGLTPACFVALILCLGRVSVIVVRDLKWEPLVLARAIPGTATDLVPFSTRTASIAPNVVEWADALEDDTPAEPVMAVPVANPPVLTRTSMVVDEPAARPPMGQASPPGPVDVHPLVPDASMPVRS